MPPSIALSLSTNLMRKTTAQPIWYINESSLDETFRREIAHTFETGTDEACSDVALLLLGEGSQRRRLTGDRMLLLLLVRRYLETGQSLK